jgi:hypothetical protein
MNADHASLSHHPAPHRDQVSLFESVFGLLGGPLAWLIQVCANYTMASWPCFPQEQPNLVPQAGFAWTGSAIIDVSIAAFIISVAAFLVSRRAFNRVRDESHGDHQHLMDVGSGRTRFLALWGMIFSAAFAVGIAMDAVAYFLLPRCAG